MKKLHLFTVRAVIVALLAVLGAFWGLSRLDAQEITPEATTAPLPPIVVEDGGTLIQEAPEAAFDYSSLLILIAGIAGIAFTGGGALMILNNVLRSKSIKDTTEKLYEGLSPTWQTTIQRTLTIAEDVLRFARETTDRLPNTETPSTEALDARIKAVVDERINETITPPTTGTTIGSASITTAGFTARPVNPSEPPAPGSLSQPKRD